MSEPSRTREASTVLGEQDDTNLQDHIREFRKVREQCGRIRVLVIGKANAGKTTILKKMCGAATDEIPVVRDVNGNEKEMHGPTQMRGIHNVEDEITFSSNPGFVFHDSCGFEAGSSSALDKVKAFILYRSTRRELRDQLHAIWYCIPTDATRPISHAELGFFAFGTGRVPVIAVFTKFDSMIDKSYNQLRKERIGRREAMERAPSHANELFRNNQLAMVDATPYPPIGHVCLSNMHLVDTSCSDLTRCTAKAMTDDILIQLFVSVQRNNLFLCIKYAIVKYILKQYVKMQHNGSDYALDFQKSMHIVIGLLTWFPHMLINDDDDDDDDALVLLVDMASFHRLFTPIISHLSGPPPSALQLLRLGICTLIIAEQSFWLSKQSAADGLSIAIDTFQESVAAPAVYNAVQGLTLPEPRTGLLVKQDVRKDLEEMNVAGQIHKIVLNNLLENPHRRV